MPSRLAPEATAAGTEITLNVEAGGKVSVVIRDFSGAPRRRVAQRLELGAC